MKSKQKPFRVFSTFTGIGGFEQGIEHVATGPIEIVGYSEIDKYAISVYEKHYKGVNNYGDITKIDADDLPEFDCIVGGFPCQAFSIAGKRAGFDDTRGTLFFDLARILRAKRPRFFVFENVKGLLNHDGGNTIKTIIQTIDELGYDCQWQVINSKNHGVPQNRERIIIVGHTRGTTRPKVFPITGTSGKDIVTINKPRHSMNRIYSTDGIAPTIKTVTGGGLQPYISMPVQLTETRTEEAKRIRREYRKSGRDYSPRRGKILVPRKDYIANTVTASQSMESFVLIPEATKKGYTEAYAGDAINLKNPKSETRRGRVSNIAPTLESLNEIHTLTPDMRIRKLTPLETERLQAFPDNWTQYGIEHFTDEHGLLQQRLKPMSDRQRYKMCGNAVTTSVIAAVFKPILDEFFQGQKQ